MLYRKASSRWARSASAVPTKAPAPPLLAVGGLPENPTLSTKRKNMAGENSKMIQGAVFLAGRVPALLAQASGLSLRASLEIGSSFGVKCHQRKNRGFVRGFLFGK